MRFWFVIVTYAAFIAAYHYLPLTIVGALWVLGAVVATIAMLRSAPGDRPSWLGRWILIGSLLIWPIQLATLSASKEDDARSEASRKDALERIGKLPATIQGVVSFDHYIDDDDPYYLVWLEEYDELAFEMNASLYESIGISEGTQVKLTVDGRDSDDGEIAIYVIEGSSTAI